MSNQGEMNYEVIDNKDKKRFEIHIDDQIALENYEFFTTSQSEKGCKQLNKIYTNLPIYYYNR